MDRNRLANLFRRIFGEYPHSHAAWTVGWHWWQFQYYDHSNHHYHSPLFILCPSSAWTSPPLALFARSDESIVLFTLCHNHHCDYHCHYLQSLLWTPLRDLFITVRDYRSIAATQCHITVTQDRYCSITQLTTHTEWNTTINWTPQSTREQTDLWPLAQGSWDMWRYWWTDLIDPTDHGTMWKYECIHSCAKV